MTLKSGLKHLLPSILVCAILLMSGTASAEPDDADKLKLKASVLQHIEGHTEDGTYFFVSSKTTKLMKLKFVAMHPVVFEHPDGTYALCADFEDGQKNKVLVDYYVQEINDRFVVLSSVEGKRSVLMGIAEKFGL